MTIHEVIIARSANLQAYHELLVVYSLLLASIFSVSNLILQFSQVMGI